MKNTIVFIICAVSILNAQDANTVTIMTNKSNITEQDYIEAAKRLNVEVAFIKAIAKKEAKSSGFNTGGTPVILYERHKFHQKTKGIYSAKYPDISNKVPGGYGKYSEQHSKLARAVQLNRTAALESCSWGLFQVMGENWMDLGYKSIQDFVNAMYRSEKDQLEAFVRFILFKKIDVDMRNKNFDNIALKYNGPNHAKNNYVPELKALYKQFGGKL